MPNAFKGIDHIGVAVKDLQDSRYTYEELLGFEIRGTEVLDDRGLEVCFVDTGNVKIELIAPTRKNSEISGFLDKRGEGIHHICVEVDDIEKTVATMISRGVKIAGGGIERGASNTKVAFIHPKSANGVLIELVQK